MSLFLNVHVLAAYSRTLIIHADSNLVLVWTWLLISLLCHRPTFLKL